MSLCRLCPEKESTDWRRQLQWGNVGAGGSCRLEFVEGDLHVGDAECGEHFLAGCNHQRGAA